MINVRCLARCRYRLKSVAKATLTDGCFVSRKSRRVQSQSQTSHVGATSSHRLSARCANRAIGTKGGGSPDVLNSSYAPVDFNKVGQRLPGGITIPLYRYLLGYSSRTASSQAFSCRRPLQKHSCVYMPSAIFPAPRLYAFVCGSVQ